MFSLDDPDLFHRVLDLRVPWAHSYADMREGKTDKERREAFRAAADGQLNPTSKPVLWWAFRIHVEKVGRALDVDNVAKTIIDAFCSWQIARDSSTRLHLGLYPNDTFEYVRVLQVLGRRSVTSDSTHIEIFSCTNVIRALEPG
jgi:hypothetical protein